MLLDLLYSYNYLNCFYIYSLVIQITIVVFSNNYSEKLSFSYLNMVVWKSI